MDGDTINSHTESLLTFAEQSMRTFHVYPYAAFIIKSGQIIAKGRNEEQETHDVTRQSEVVAIREAQKILTTGSLEGCTLLSLMEPTILSFDVALWTGIREFAWCVDSSYFSEHYNVMRYSPLSYASHHPQKISITRGLHSAEAIQLIEEAKKLRYYPDKFLIR